MREPGAEPTPRVAVLIPVYGDDGRLAATLRSLGAQTVPCVAVVVDDGSPVPVVADADAAGVPVVLLRRAANGGIERALNDGLRHIRDAGFELVARLDNGDVCLPERLERQVAFLDAHPDVALVGTGVAWVDDAGREVFRLPVPTTHEAISRAFHHTVTLIHPTVVLRTSVIAELGEYRTDYPAAEDYELFWRIARRHRVANLADMLVLTRFDPDGVSIRRRRRQLATRWRIQCEQFRVGEPLAWYGLLKTGVLRVLPYSLIVAAKRQLGRRLGRRDVPQAATA